MPAIVPFNISLLRIEEVRGFCQEMDAKVQQVSTIADSNPGQNFHNSIMKYENLRKLERGLQYSDLTKADANMDQALSGMRGHLKTFLAYPIDHIREAAKIIWEAIDQFGAPAKLSFSEEHPVVKNILTVLEELDPELLEKTMVNAWVTLLRERYETLVDMIGRYDRERVAMGPGRLKTARDEMIAAWKPLCDAINGLNLISPSDELAGLIDEINVRIQSRKTILKQRKAAKRNNSMPVEEVPAEEVSEEA